MRTHRFRETTARRHGSRVKNVGEIEGINDGNYTPGFKSRRPAALDPRLLRPPPVSCPPKAQ